MIKVGICGFGKAVEEFHLPGIKISKKFKITSIFDITKPRLDKAKKDLDVDIFSSYEDFLKSKPEVVIIATPSNSHYEYAIKTMDAGIGVIVEKPMALNVKDCDGMIRKKAAKKVLLTVYHNRRWDGDFLAVKKLVDNGKLGKIKFLASRAMSYGSILDYSVPEFDRGWRYKKGFGGGQLFDFGAHLIDQVMMLLKDMPEIISCELKKETWTKEVDTYFKLNLRFKKDIDCEVIASQISKESLPRWEIRGDKGTLLCETGAGPLRLKLKNGEEILEVKKNQYQKFYDNLYDVFTKGAALEVRPEQARDVVAIIEKAYNLALSSSLA